MHDYLTIKQAAEFLKVTEQTLRNWDKAKKFKTRRHPINNYRLYKKSELISFIERIK